jgi:hypothetical protein
MTSGVLASKKFVAGLKVGVATEMQRIQDTSLPLVHAGILLVHQRGTDPR